MFVYELVVILAMLAFNAVFAAYEMALASISRARLAALLHDRRKGAVDAVYMKDRMEASLAVVQVGITVVGAVAAATGGAGVQEQFSPYLQQQWGLSKTPADVVALVILVVPLTFVTIVFAELVPKMIALHNNDWVVLRLSPPMRVLSRLAYPIVWITEATVKGVVRLLPHQGGAPSGAKSQWLHELRAAVSLARASKLLGEREEKIVLSAAQMSARPVGEIVIPAADMSMIYVGSSLMEALVQAHLDMHTRYPVAESRDNPESFVGYVNFKDIVATLRIAPHEPSLRGILRPLVHFKSTATVAECLERLIHEHNHIAVVRDAEGRVVGIVTLEDILEELVGEIHDEYDRLPAHVVPTWHGWIVGGSLPLGKLAEVMGSPLEMEAGMLPTDTLNAWIARRLGRPARSGDLVRANGWQFVVRKVRRQAVVEAFVTRAS